MKLTIASFLTIAIMSLSTFAQDFSVGHQTGGSNVLVYGIAVLAIIACVESAGLVVRRNR